MDQAFQRLVGADLAFSRAGTSAAEVTAVQKAESAFEKAAEAAVIDSSEVPDDEQRALGLCLRFEGLVRAYWVALAKKTGFQGIEPSALESSRALESLHTHLQHICAVSSRAKRALLDGGALMACFVASLAHVNLDTDGIRRIVPFMNWFATEVLSKRWSVQRLWADVTHSRGLGPRALAARFCSPELLSCLPRVPYLDEKGPVSVPAGRTPLAQAFFHGNTAAFEWLLERDSFTCCENDEDVHFHLFRNALRSSDQGKPIDGPLLTTRQSMLRLLLAKRPGLASKVEIDHRWLGINHIPKACDLLGAAIQSRDPVVVQIALSALDKPAEPGPPSQLFRYCRVQSETVSATGPRIMYQLAPTLVIALKHPSYEVLELLVKRGILEEWRDKYDEPAGVLVARALAQVACVACGAARYNAKHLEPPLKQPEAERILDLVLSTRFDCYWEPERRSELYKALVLAAPDNRSLEEQEEVIKVLRLFRDKGARAADSDSHSTTAGEGVEVGAELTPADYAILRGQQKVLDFAIEECGCPIELPSPSGISLLYGALCNDKPQIATHLVIKHRAKGWRPGVSATDQPLHILLEAQKSTDDQTAPLLRAIIDVQPSLFVDEAFTGDTTLEWSPIIACVESNFLQCLEVLLTSELPGVKELALRASERSSTSGPPAEIAAQRCQWDALDLLLKHTDAGDTVAARGFATILHFQKYDVAEALLRRDGFLAGWRETNDEASLELLADQLAWAAVIAYPRNPACDSPATGVLPPSNPRTLPIVDAVLAKGFNHSWLAGGANAILRSLYPFRFSPASDSTAGSRIGILSDEHTRAVLERYHAAGAVVSHLSKEAKEEDDWRLSLGFLACRGHPRVLEFAIEVCGCPVDASFLHHEGGMVNTCLVEALYFAQVDIALQLLRKHKARASYPGKPADTQPIFIVLARALVNAPDAALELTKALIERDPSLLDIDCFKGPSVKWSPLVACVEAGQQGLSCLEVLLTSKLPGVDGLAHADSVLDLAARKSNHGAAELISEHTTVKASVATLGLFLCTGAFELATTAVEHGSLDGWRERFDENTICSLAEALAFAAVFAYHIHISVNSKTTAQARDGARDLAACRAVDAFLAKGFNWPWSGTGFKSNAIVARVYHPMQFSGRPTMLIQGNALALLRCFHRAGVSLGARDGTHTLAHEAAKHGHLNVLEFAIKECGCPCDSAVVVSGDWTTPLNAALTARQHLAAKKLLAEFKAAACYPLESSSKQPIMQVLGHCEDDEEYMRLIEALIERDRSLLDVDCFKQPTVGCSPITDAVMLNKPRALELLLANDLPNAKELAVRLCPLRGVFVEGRPLATSPAQAAVLMQRWDCLEVLLKNTEAAVTEPGPLPPDHMTIAETVIRATREPNPPSRALVALVLSRARDEKARAAPALNTVAASPSAASSSAEVVPAAAVGAGLSPRFRETNGFEDPLFAQFSADEGGAAQAADTDVAEASGKAAHKDKGARGEKTKRKRRKAKARKGEASGDGRGDSSSDEAEELFEEPDDNLVDSRFAPSVDVMFAAMGLGPGGVPLEASSGAGEATPAPRCTTTDDGAAVARGTDGCS